MVDPAITWQEMSLRRLISYREAGFRRELLVEFRDAIPWGSGVVAAAMSHKVRPRPDLPAKECKKFVVKMIYLAEGDLVSSPGREHRHWCLLLGAHRECQSPKDNESSFIQ